MVKVAHFFVLFYPAITLNVFSLAARIHL